MPTRVGFQCPFSNLTFDIMVPKTLAGEAVIIGGQLQDDVYGDFQAEMDIFNRAFCDVMMEGDAKGRVFTFPIPTINVTRDFDWDSDVVNAFMEITCQVRHSVFLQLHQLRPFARRTPSPCAAGCGWTPRSCASAAAAFSAPTR